MGFLGALASGALRAPLARGGLGAPRRRRQPLGVTVPPQVLTTPRQHRASMAEERLKRADRGTGPGSLRLWLQSWVQNRPRDRYQRGSIGSRREPAKGFEPPTSCLQNGLGASEASAGVPRVR